MLVIPTEVDLQQQLCLAQLQRDVVALLALPMENHSVALWCLKPQRDHVLNDLHLFHLPQRREPALWATNKQVHKQKKVDISRKFLWYLKTVRDHSLSVKVYYSRPWKSKKVRSGKIWDRQQENWQEEAKTWNNYQGEGLVKSSDCRGRGRKEQLIFGK